MSNYLAIVDSNKNSVQGGQPVVVTFKGGALNYGDVLTISTSTSTVWSNGGTPPPGTNADGAQVTINNGEITILWNTVLPVQPTNNPSLPPYTIQATNYTYGVGCLVGSFDNGQTYFPIGTNYNFIYLGTGAGSSAPKNISLFFWDLNQGDNSGSITFDISLQRASS